MFFCPRSTPPMNVRCRFTEGGFFGGNVQKVEVELACAQSGELKPQQETAATPLSSFRRITVHECPKCYFTFAWNGSSCSHCHYTNTK